MTARRTAPTGAPYPPSAFDFYAETTDDGLDAGTVAAVHRPSSSLALATHGCYEGLAGISTRDGDAESPEHAPSGPCVSWLAIAPAYLDRRCRAITEAEARRIHPALFVRLDAAAAAGEWPDGDLGTAAAALHMNPAGEA